jgi:hypothetical protein
MKPRQRGQCVPAYCGHWSNEGMLPNMNYRLALMLWPLLIVCDASPAEAQETEKVEEAARIESECGLETGTITIIGDQISFRPSPDEAYENVDCGLGRLMGADIGKLGFVGNEADPNTLLHAPVRYIAEGSTAEITALTKAAEAENWTINKTATATDGTAIIQFESGAKMTHGQAARLLDRIWKKEFGDIAFGPAPTKLSDSESFDE